MSDKELLEDIEKRAFKYSQEYKACSQCTLLPIQEMFDLTNDDVLKAATGFAGGIAHEELRSQRREEIEQKLGTLIKNLRARFEEEYGSIICDDIEIKLFGRSFDKWNPEDREEKGRLGGYEDKCPSVVGKAARWVAELILEEKGKK